MPAKSIQIGENKVFLTRETLKILLYDTGITSSAKTIQRAWKRFIVKMPFEERKKKKLEYEKKKLEESKTKKSKEERMESLENLLNMDDLNVSYENETEEEKLGRVRRERRIRAELDALEANFKLVSYTPPTSLSLSLILPSQPINSAHPAKRANPKRHGARITNFRSGI